MNLTLKAATRVAGRYMIRIMALACLVLVLMAYIDGFPEAGASMLLGGVMGYMTKAEEVHDEQP